MRFSNQESKHDPELTLSLLWRFKTHELVKPNEHSQETLYWYIFTGKASVMPPLKEPRPREKNTGNTEQLVCLHDVATWCIDLQTSKIGTIFFSVISLRHAPEAPKMMRNTIHRWLHMSSCKNRRYAKYTRACKSYLLHASAIWPCRYVLD